MTLFHVYNTTSGDDLGVHEGVMQRDALDAMARSAGYPHFAAYMDALHFRPGEFRVSALPDESELEALFVGDVAEALLAGMSEDEVYEDHWTFWRHHDHGGQNAIHIAYDADARRGGIALVGRRADRSARWVDAASPIDTLHIYLKSTLPR